MPANHTQRLDRIREYFPPETSIQGAMYARLLAALDLPEEDLTDDEVILLAWCADWGSTSERLANLITRARERHPSPEGKSVSMTTTEQPSYVATIRRMLRAEMDAQGVDSAALAQRLDWPERTLLGYLDGPRRLLVDALDDICRELGIEAAELLHRAEEALLVGSPTCSG